MHKNCFIIINNNNVILDLIFSLFKIQKLKNKFICIINETISNQTQFNLIKYKLMHNSMIEEKVLIKLNISFIDKIIMCQIQNLISFLNKNKLLFILTNNTSYDFNKINNINFIYLKKKNHILVLKYFCKQKLINFNNKIINIYIKFNFNLIETIRYLNISNNYIIDNYIFNNNIFKHKIWYNILYKKHKIVLDYFKKIKCKVRFYQMLKSEIIDLFNQDSNLKITKYINQNNLNILIINDINYLLKYKSYLLNKILLIEIKLKILKIDICYDIINILTLILNYKI